MARMSEEEEEEEEVLEKRSFRSRRRRRRLSLQEEHDRPCMVRLLYDRECGRRVELLKKDGRSSSNNNNDDEWKGFVIRSIPFSKLQTPLADAILSLDSDGSYMMSLSNTSIRFYGVPSPSRLERKSGVVSPLLGSVPVLRHCRRENENGTVPSALFGRDDEVSIASSIPVQILTTADNRLGVAMLQHSSSSSSLSWDAEFANPILTESPATQDVDCLGTIVIFLLPNACGHQAHICLENVRLNGWHTATNTLWKTHIFPFSGRCYERQNGYLFFNDEDDGFRMLWIDLLPSTISPQTYTPTQQQPPPPQAHVVANLFTQPNDGGGMPNFPSPSHHHHSCHKCGLFLRHESYLQMDTLLRAILQRRRFHTNNNNAVLPEYQYQLISFDSKQQRIFLVLVFANPIISKPPASLGIFIHIYYFTQSYHEINWVQHPTKQDATFLQQWCHTLAIHARRNETQPPSSPPESTSSSLSLLYPFCDLITNQAVIHHCPVSFIQSKHLPVRLSYG